MRGPGGSPVIEPAPQVVVVPGTRRRVNLGDAKSVAAGVVAVKALRGKLTKAQDQFKSALVDLLDHENERTVDAGGGSSVVLNPPTAREVDGAQLHAALDDFVVQGVDSADAADRAVHVEYVVNLNEVDKLVSLGNADLRRAIQDATEYVGQARTVTVKERRS